MLLHLCPDSPRQCLTLWQELKQEPASGPQLGLDTKIICCCF